MKKIIFFISFICTVTSIYAQTYMKIIQGTGTIFSEGNTVDEISFTTTFNCGDAILYGGEMYPIVQIGEQCWMAKNLNIGNMISGNTDQLNNNIMEKYCYNDYEANCITYGALYQWDEAMQFNLSPGYQGICPTGWHVPTLEEFEILRIQSNNLSANLKAVGQGVGEAAGTNYTGFSALLSGRHGVSGDFWDLGILTLFWSSTDAFAGEPDYVNALSFFGGPYDEISLGGWHRGNAFSVRCLKD